MILGISWLYAMASLLHFQVLWLFICIILSAHQNQENALHKKEQSFFKFEIFKNDSEDKLSHSIVLKNATEFSNVSMSDELCEFLMKVCDLGLIESVKKNYRTFFKKEILPPKEKIIHAQSNSTENILKFLEFNYLDTRSFLKINDGMDIQIENKRAFGYSPLPTDSVTIDRVHDRNSLRSNITYEYSYQDHNMSHVVAKAIILFLFSIWMIGGQLNFKDEPSDYINLNKKCSNTSLLLLDYLNRYTDVSSIFSASYVDKKDHDFIRSITSKVPSKSMLPDFHNHPSRYLTHQFVYPVLNMTRLASYRSILSAQSPVPFVQLSEAGFRYSGEEHIVCESCYKSNHLMSVVTSPFNAIYHNQGCINIRPVASIDNSNTEGPTERGDSSIGLICANRQAIDSHFLANKERTESLLIDESYLQTLSGELHEYSFNIPSLINTDLFMNQFSGIDSNRDAALHANYFPLHSLTTTSLPLEYQEEHFFQSIQLCSKLTAKLECKEKQTSGSGYILNYPCKIISTKTIQAIPSLKEKLGDLVHNQHLGVIYVQTTSHMLLVNKTVVTETEVSLSLDNTTYKNVKLNGKTVLFNNKKGIFQALLVCLTNDLQLITTINKLQKDVIDLVKLIPNSMKDFMSQSVFIISHPHGEEKMLSLGKASLRNYVILKKNERDEILVEHGNKPTSNELADNLRTVLIYSSITCHGSSGALVVTFRMSPSTSNWCLDIWTHNGINRADQMGVAVPREYIQGSTSQIVSSATRGQQDALYQPDLNNRLLATTQNADPVSYPVYLNIAKRIESLLNWRFAHILDPNILAQSGFFYAGYGDCVRCFQCGLGLRSWKLGDDVLVEHEKFRPSCSFLQSILAGRIVNSVELNPQAPSPGHYYTTFTEGNDLDNPKFRMLLAPTHNENTTTGTKDQSASNVSREENTYQDNSASIQLQEIALQDNLNTEGYSASNDQNESQELEISSLSIYRDTSPQENCTDAKPITASLLKRENKRLHDMLKCKLCKEAAIKELFLPCGHLYACSECSQKLNRCPECQTKILGTVTTFFA